MAGLLIPGSASQTQARIRGARVKRARQVCKGRCWCDTCRGSERLVGQLMLRKKSKNVMQQIARCHVLTLKSAWALNSVSSNSWCICIWTCTAQRSCFQTPCHLVKPMHKPQ